jgi:hypothetical protein
MRHGMAATVTIGPYAGDQLSVDHIIPRAVVPELDNVIANLELMPLRMNARKNSHMRQRQRDLAQKLFESGGLVQTGRRDRQRTFRTLRQFGFSDPSFPNPPELSDFWVHCFGRSCCCCGREGPSQLRISARAPGCSGRLSSSAESRRRQRKKLALYTGWWSSRLRWSAWNRQCSS